MPMSVVIAGQFVGISPSVQPLRILRHIFKERSPTLLRWQDFHSLEIDQASGDAFTVSTN
jgi:hypothetical protein